MTLSSAEVPMATFRTLVQAVQAICCECLLNITESGLCIAVVDPENVAMVVAEMPRESFGFLTFGLHPQVIGIDISQMHTSLKDFRNVAARITVKNDGNYDRDHQNKLIIRGGRSALGVKLLDPVTVRKHPTPPTLKLPTEFVLDSEEFTRAIKAVSVISEKVCIEVGDEVLIIGQSETSKVVIKPRSMVRTKEPARSVFALDYLLDMGRVMEGGSEVTIKMGTDYPATFSFVKDGVRIQYLLAPRISDDVPLIGTRSR